MRRRLTLILLAFIATIVVVCLAGWGYIYTHQQQVAATISAQLSDQLNIPVTVENPVLGFHPAPTLDIENIQLNVTKKNLTIHIKKLQVGFSWQSITSGTLQIDQLDIIQPNIVWTLSATEQEHVNHEKTLATINNISDSLGEVRIVDGSLQLLNIPHQKGQDTALNLDVQHLNITISNGARNTNREVALSGQLAQEQHTPAPFSIRAQLAKSTPQWSNAQVQIRSVLENIQTNQFFEPNQVHTNGPLTLHLNLNGSLAAGLTVNSSMTPTNNDKLLIKVGDIKYPLYHANCNTLLHYHANALQFDHLKLGYNGLTVRGDLTIKDWQSDATLHAALRSDQIDFKQADRWLPAPIVAKIPAFSQNAIVECRQVIVDGPVKGFSIDHIKEAQFNIKQAKLDTQGITANNFNVNIHWQDGQGEISTSPLSYTYKRIHAQGPLQLQLRHSLNGHWSISSDLNSWMIDLAGAFKKNSDQAGSLTFHLTRETATNNFAEITNGNLQLPGYTILFSGQQRKNGDIQFDLNVPHYQLETISNEIPVLKRMELSGAIALEYQIRKKQGQPITSSGNVELHDCSIFPTYTISPIHHINGTMALKGLSAQAPELTFILGDSPMTADAYIHDLRHPVAEIHAKGDGVIAKDLVFNSPNMLLNNLEGRIAIHAKGIDFIEASVDLEQGTHATVNGTLIFKKPLLELNIEAPYANINEIIALWSDSPPEKKPHNTHTHTHTHTHKHKHKQIHDEFIHIKAHVGNGVISGFEFQQARGTIHYKSGQLRVEPLFFQADNGTGKGAIYVIRRDAPAMTSLLKISGTLSDINADKVYKQLFRHVGLVTGTLNGNFTIHGPAGSEFLQRSQGDFHLDIQHGVLRQFKTLSKAFSILNIAQLFALKLPDMDSEGMPFKDLGADIALNNGVLHSENLVINSSSMGISVIGEHNLVSQKIDLIMGIKPLATVDTLVKHIPIAGWILAGEEQAVITTHFNVSGNASDPTVEMLPLSSISKKVFNIFKRTLKLPGTLITDPKKILINPQD